eukprot:PITA_24656
MLLCSSTHGLNSFFGLQPQSKLNLRRSVQLTQLHATGNSDGQLFHHDVHHICERTLSGVDFHNSLSNGSLRRLGLRSGTLELCRKLSTENFVSNVVLDEVLYEFEDSDTQMSIGLQSNRDPQEEFRGKNMAAIGVHAGEGFFPSGRRNDDLMSDGIFEGTGVALAYNRIDLETKTSTGSVNGGFGGGVQYGGGGDGSGSDSNNTDAYYKKMLRANPDNPLLLTNYARFLQEVQHDVEKAEEYYGRVILASPGDGEALSNYANIIWDVHKDAPRAQTYFDQDVEAAPDDW